jgi:hypothetical protein
MLLGFIDARLFAWVWILAWPPGFVVELFLRGVSRLEVLALGTVVWLLFVWLEILPISNFE